MVVQSMLATKGPIAYHRTHILRRELGTCSTAGELEDCRTTSRTQSHLYNVGMSRGVEVLVKRLLAAQRSSRNRCICISS